MAASDKLVSITLTDNKSGEVVKQAFIPIAKLKEIIASQRANGYTVTATDEDLKAADDVDAVAELISLLPKLRAIVANAKAPFP